MLMTMLSAPVGSVVVSGRHHDAGRPCERRVIVRSGSIERVARLRTRRSRRTRRSCEHAEPSSGVKTMSNEPVPGMPSNCAARQSGSL